MARESNLQVAKRQLAYVIAPGGQLNHMEQTLLESVITASQEELRLHNSLLEDQVKLLKADVIFWRGEAQRWRELYNNKPTPGSHATGGE